MNNKGPALTIREVSELIAKSLSNTRRHNFDRHALITRTGYAESHFRDRISKDQQGWGYFQIEYPTFQSLLVHTLPAIPKDDPIHKYGIVELFERRGVRHDMFKNIMLSNSYTSFLFQVELCDLKYRTVKDPIPPAHDVVAQAEYWKKHYNTPGGAGTVKYFTREAYKLNFIEVL